MDKCYICGEKSTQTQKIGDLTYHYCWGCALEVAEATKAVKKLSDNELETTYAIIEKTKQEKDEYYLAVFQAILNRKDYENDLSSIILAIQECL